MITSVNDDLGDDAATDRANPLLRPLESEEMDLLDTIWDPVTRRAARWPVWDYVSRTLYGGPSRVPDAGTILASLPTMPDPMPSNIFGRHYGLVWHTSSVPGVADDAHVGLTIAGLLRLSERHSPLRAIADRLAGAISALAAAERDTIPDPQQVVRPEVPLTPILRELTADLGSAVSLPSQVVVDVLLRESAPLGVMLDAEPPMARPTMLIRPYGDLTGAEDYLARINRLSVQRQRPAPVRRAEELAQTLDYVSHVLAMHPAWNKRPLLGTLDLETAVALAGEATTQDEFSHRLSALAIVLGRLQVPELDQDTLQRHRIDDQAGPLVRLRAWLEDFIQDDGGRERAVDAVKDIQSANDLRVQAQHGGTKPRTRASQACARLGIEDPIRAWSPAWWVVRARVADAFDVIRQEVTAQPGQPS